MGTYSKTSSTHPISALRRVPRTAHWTPAYTSPPLITSSVILAILHSESILSFYWHKTATYNVRSLSPTLLLPATHCWKVSERKQSFLLCRLKKGVKCKYSSEWSTVILKGLANLMFFLEETKLKNWRRKESWDNFLRLYPFSRAESRRDSWFLCHVMGYRPSQGHPCIHMFPRVDVFISCHRP